MLTRNALLLAKIEATYGVDSIPVPATDAMLVSLPDIKPDGEVKERDFVRQSFSPIGHVIGKKKINITIKMELKGSGTAGTAPQFGPILRACGMEETIDAGVSVTYAPRSTGYESCTIYLYLDGLLHKVPGCVGTWSVNMEAGNFGEITFELQGKYVKPTDITFPTTGPSLDPTPEVVENASFTAGGYAAIINALQYSHSNTIGAPGNVNADDGYGDLRITGRDPNGSFDPESTLLATHDFWDAWENATAQALTITIGATAGNIVDFDVDFAVPREIGYGDREGIRTHDIPFTAKGSVGEDECEFIFT